MESSYVEFLGRLRRAAEAVDRLPTGEEAPYRPEDVAALLHSLWPGASLYVCVLGREGDVRAAVLDEAGGRRPEWEGAFRDRLLQADASRTAEAGRTPPPAGGVLAWEDVRRGDRVRAALALAVPDGRPCELEAAHVFLAVVGRLLAARLETDALERERGALADEAAGNARLADVGEASVPMAHEFNNFLNGLLLHLAVLHYKLPAETHEGLDQIRQQAMGAAALIQEFQNYRRKGQNAERPADLNRAVRAAVRALGGPAVSAVRLDLTAEEVPVAAPYGDLRRLCVFLLRSASGAAAVQGGGVVVRTARPGNKVVLRVEDEGPPLGPEELAHLFDASGPGREGCHTLELAACRTLARRLQAGIHAESRSEGGVTVGVEWNATQKDEG